MPQVFNWVEVRTLRSSTPPVDAFLLKEGLCSPESVWDILRIFCINRWSGSLFLINGRRVISTTSQKRSAFMIPSQMQILVVPWRLIPTPHRHELGCFGFGFRLVGSSAILKHVGRYDWREIEHSPIKITLWKVLPLQNASCELQPLNFVGVTNQLAIGGPLQSSALLLSRSPYRG